MLTGCTSGFTTITMSWICNLQRLGIFSNVLIAAFDEQAYVALYLLGMPVFMAGKTLSSSSKTAFDYGQEAYKAVTKLKTAVVVEILKMGRDVVWCDPDIVIFQPFVPILTSSPHEFQVQNNNPTSLKKVVAMKTNSGFYLARAVPWVVEALSKVIHHAAKSTKSEQMSWNAVLCKHQSISGKTCAWHGHTINFLHRNQFATGNETDSLYPKLVAGNGAIPTDLVVWHNNWITGYDNKVKRVKKLGFLYWDHHWGHCSSPAERKTLKTYFTHSKKRKHEQKHHARH